MFVLCSVCSSCDGVSVHVCRIARRDADAGRRAEAKRDTRYHLLYSCVCIVCLVMWCFNNASLYYGSQESDFQADVEAMDAEMDRV